MTLMNYFDELLDGGIDPAPPQLRPKRVAKDDVPNKARGEFATEGEVQED
jgi:hypothetical protein